MSQYFDRLYEVTSIHNGFQRDYQEPIGTSVQWYRYLEGTSEHHPVYDEPFPGGTTDWASPITVPVLVAFQYEGGSTPGDSGFYTTDRLNVTLSSRTARDFGLGNLQEDRTHLKDRIVYQNVVFSPEQIRVAGQIGDYEVIVGLDCAEVDPDELVNAPDFAKYAR